MNILLIAKMGAAVAALFIAYWIGPGRTYIIFNKTSLTH